MNEFNRTPAAPARTIPQSDAAQRPRLPVLSADGIDTRMWRELDAVEQAARMEKYDRDWWAFYRLSVAAEVAQ